MSCCITPEEIEVNERTAILPTYKQKSRQGREARERRTAEKIVLSFLKAAFCSSGYWVPSTCCYSYVLLLFLITCFQLVYDVVTVFYCPNFDCRFLLSNKTEKNPTRSLQNAAYTFASCGGLLSFAFMVFSLYLAARKYKNAVALKMMHKDLGRKRLYVLGWMLLVLALLFFTSVGLFFYLVRDEVKSRYYCLLVSGVGSQFITQWTGIVSCFVFGTICFIIGTFSRDVERRIREMHTANINLPITVHKEFASIVRDTVSAFSLWFVLHWISYSITTILALVVLLKHFGDENTILKKIYLVLFSAVHLLLFVVPCGFAAYMTSVCGRIPSAFNEKTEEFWPEQSLFRDRTTLQLFVSYARESSVSFKIGRITFTSTLAWISLFLGLSGLASKFF
eukprot:gene321-951_t